MLELTNKGEAQLKSLQIIGWLNLEPGDHPIYNILLDIYLSNNQYPGCETFLQPNRDSVVGRIIKRKPSLYSLFEDTLSEAIEKGFIQ